jgi:quercetin dioxygenase-like cupin family protein
MIASVAMTRTRILYLTSSLLIAGLAFVAGHAIGAAPKVSKYMAVGELTWTPMDPNAGAAGPQLSPIDGDPMKGAHVSLMKIPAGFTAPMHTHTADYWAVGVQGTHVHWMETETEAAAKKLGPGGWWHVPGKVKHQDKCLAGADCIFVLVQKKKIDFKPVAAAAPAKGAEPAKPAAPAAPMAPAKKTP